MNYTWTDIAIENGANILIKRGVNPVQITLRWPKEIHADDICVIGKNADIAMNNLEQALQDDAALEMVESGKV